MKLRNKKTGEIIIPSDYTFATYDDGIRYGRHTYYSLAELNEDWEDYEEPKVIYYISWDGMVLNSADRTGWQNAKQIGNYFETKEEAEKAVEKLKAWKRLKDKGFEIESYSINIGDNYYKTGQIMLNLNNVMNRDWDEYDQIDEIKNDLDLLFGGEE